MEALEGTISDLQAVTGMLRAVAALDPPRSAEVDDDLRRLGDMASELHADALDVLEVLAVLSVPHLTLVNGERSSDGHRPFPRRRPGDRLRSGVPLVRRVGRQAGS